MPHRGSRGGAGGSPVLLSWPVSVPGAVAAVLPVAPVLVPVLGPVLVLELEGPGAVVAGPGPLVPGRSEPDDPLVLEPPAAGVWSVHPPETRATASKKGSTGP